MTNRPKVLVDISMHKEARSHLNEVADVDLLPSDRESLLRIIGNYEGVITYVPRFDKEILTKARKLKVISCHACSEDTFRAASQRGISITVVPSMRDTVVDMTLALLFAAARMIPQAYSAIKNELWGQTDLKVLFSGQDIFGKTLGIIGLGRIGTILAKRVQGFDMKVLYYDAIRKKELEKELNLEYRALEQLLAEADIVSIHVPSKEDTRGMIGEKELRLMKEKAILVNTARGAIIDEPALYRALKEGWISAAGLDVFVEEPIKPENPLLTLDNVVFAPHLGGSTKDCDMVLVDDTIRVLRGEKPIHPIPYSSEGRKAFTPT